MPTLDHFVLYGSIFFAVLVGVEGLLMVIGDLRKRTRASVNRRQRILAGTTDREAAIQLLRRQSPEKGPLARLARFAPVQVLDRMMLKAGMTMPASRFMAVMLALAGGLFVLLRANHPANPAVQSLLLAAGLGLGMPLLFLRLRGRRRLKLFGQQLPDAIDMIVRSLRAGHPVTAALKMVGESMPEPIGTEFGLVVDEMTYGLDLKEAMEKMAQRIDLQDLHYMVVAIKIQHGSGGNLADVLAGLSAVIRSRAKMFKKIRAVSAEGRLSGFVVGSLPVLVGGGTTLLNPDYYQSAAGEPALVIGLSVAGGLIVVGNALIFRMVHFKI